MLVATTDLMLMMGLNGKVNSGGGGVCIVIIISGTGIDGGSSGRLH